MTKRTLDDIPKRPPPLSNRTAQIATILAVAVRNAMEDFHCKHLSDAQMEELNPIVRNAIATALYALEHSSMNARARKCVSSTAQRIPTYWEAPKLLVSFSRGGFLKLVRQWCRDSGKTEPAEVLEMAEGLLNDDA
jgi:hypothetical protein